MNEWDSANTSAFDTFVTARPTCKANDFPCKAREEIVMFVIWEAIGQSRMRSKSTQRLSVGWWEFSAMLQRVSV